MRAPIIIRAGILELLVEASSACWGETDRGARAKLTSLHSHQDNCSLWSFSTTNMSVVGALRRESVRMIYNALSTEWFVRTRTETWTQDALHDAPLSGCFSDMPNSIVMFITTVQPDRFFLWQVCFMLLCALHYSHSLSRWSFSLPLLLIILTPSSVDHSHSLSCWSFSLPLPLIILTPSPVDHSHSLSRWFADVPDSSVILRAHTPLSNLLSCVWYNEVVRFTHRDQLGFGFVRDRILRTVPGWRINMFSDGERRSFARLLHHAIRNASLSGGTFVGADTSRGEYLSQAHVLFSNA